jgi:hypothetical protein
MQLIQFESIGYLVDDDSREAAFAVLRTRVGLKPTDILSASTGELVGITKIGGIRPELRAQRLREIAQIVMNDFAGDLNNALQLPYARAVKALKTFPSVGDPGAKKILLFTKHFRFWRWSRMACECYSDWDSGKRIRTIRPTIARRVRRCRIRLGMTVTS